MTLTDLQHDAWQIAEDKGHHKALDLMPLREASMIRLALLHTEIDELYAAPTRQVEAVADECADVGIRLLDFLQALSLPLEPTLAVMDGTAMHYEKYQTLLACFALHRYTCNLTQAIKRRGPEEGADHLAYYSVCLWRAVEDVTVTWGIDLLAAIQAKMSVNRERPYQYGTPMEEQRHA